MKVCFSIKGIIYLYKYVCKGHNVANILIMPQFKENHNEITKFYISQWVGLAEVYWRLFGQSMSSLKPHM